MHVSVDEARQQQIAADIQDRPGIRPMVRFYAAERNDPARFDADIDKPPVGEPTICQMHINAHVTSAERRYQDRILTR